MHPPKTLTLNMRPPWALGPGSHAANIWSTTQPALPSSKGASSVQPVGYLTLLTLPH